MPQVSPVVEEVATEEQVDLYMDEVKEVDLDMDEVEVEEVVEAAVVLVKVLVKAVKEKVIVIVTTTIEVRSTIMELIYRILQGN